MPLASAKRIYYVFTHRARYFSPILIKFGISRQIFIKSHSFQFNAKTSFGNRTGKCVPLLIDTPEFPTPVGYIGSCSRSHY